MPRGRPRLPPWSRPRSRRRRCRSSVSVSTSSTSSTISSSCSWSWSSFVIVVVLGLAGGLALGLALARLHPTPTARALRLGVGGLALTPTVELVVLVARHHHGDVAGALADARAAATCTRRQRFMVGPSSANGGGVHDRLGRAASQKRRISRVGDVLADDQAQDLAVAEGVAGVALHQRTRDAEREPDQQAESGPRHPQLADDHGLLGAAARRRTASARPHRGRSTASRRRCWPARRRRPGRAGPPDRAAAGDGPRAGPVPPATTGTSSAVTEHSRGRWRDW